MFLDSYLNDLLRLRFLVGSLSSPLEDEEFEKRILVELRKLILAHEVYNRITIAVTGLQGHGKTTFVSMITDAAQLKGNAGRGEKIPILVRSNGQTSQRKVLRLSQNVSSQTYKTELVVADENNWESVVSGKSLTSSTGDVSDLIPVLEIPQIDIGIDEDLQILLLPGVEKIDNKNQIWQELLGLSLSFCDICLFVCDATRLSEQAVLNQIADVRKKLVVGNEPIIVLTHCDETGGKLSYENLIKSLPEIFGDLKVIFSDTDRVDILKNDIRSMLQGSLRNFELKKFQLKYFGDTLKSIRKISKEVLDNSMILEFSESKDKVVKAIIDRYNTHAEEYINTLIDNIEAIVNDYNKEHKKDLKNEVVGKINPLFRKLVRVWRDVTSGPKEKEERIEKIFSEYFGGPKWQKYYANRSAKVFKLLADKELQYLNGLCKEEKDKIRDSIEYLCSSKDLIPEKIVSSLDVLPIILLSQHLMSNASSLCRFVDSDTLIDRDMTDAKATAALNQYLSDTKDNAVNSAKMILGLFGINVVDYTIDGDFDLLNLAKRMFSLTLSTKVTTMLFPNLVPLTVAALVFKDLPALWNKLNEQERDDLTAVNVAIEHWTEIITKKMASEVGKLSHHISDQMEKFLLQKMDAYYEENLLFELNVTARRILHTTDDYFRKYQALGPIYVE